MWSHWQNETHFTQHARGSWSLLSSPHCLLLKRPTHMHALTVAKISALTVLSRAVLLLCRQTKQAELLWCASPPDQSRPAKPSRRAACLCLFAPAQNLAVLHLAVTQLQSHLAFTGKVLKD